MKYYEKLAQQAYILRLQSLYYELKYYIERKQSHIKILLSYNSRGIGKTSTLMKLSKEYNIPILVPSIIRTRDLTYKPRPCQPFPSIITENDIYSLKPNTMILVDEKQILDYETIEYLNNFIQIGFKTITC